MGAGEDTLSEEDSRFLVPGINGKNGAMEFFLWSLQLLPDGPFSEPTLQLWAPLEVSYTPCKQLLPHQMHELTTGVKARLGFALYFSLAFSSN